MNTIFFSSQGSEYAAALLARKQISIDEIMLKIEQGKSSIRAVMGTMEADAWERGAFETLEHNQHEETKCTR